MLGDILQIRLTYGAENKASPLFQYDYGQVLQFLGVDLPEAYEVHFSNSPRGESKTMIGNADGVEIPDEYLLSGAPVYVWLFLHTGADDGETEYRAVIPVTARAKPTDAEPTPVQQDVITQAIAALNQAVDETAQSAEDAANYAEIASAQAADAAGYAGRAAQSAEDAASAVGNAEQYALRAESARDRAITAETNASASATQASQSATQAQGSATAAAQSANAASQSAANAAASATSAGQSATSASQSASSAAQSAGNAATSETNANAAKTAAQTAQNAAETAQGLAQTAATNAASSATAAAGSAEAAQTSASNAAASETAAAGYAETAGQLVEGVAQEDTAQDVLSETQNITTQVETIVELLQALERVQGRIGYVDELPSEGEEGYTYITPEGIWHYANGEWVQLSGGGSGSLNGFSLSLDGLNRVVLGYVNPEDETDTAEAVMPTDSAGAEIVEQLKAINASLYTMIPTEG